MLVLLAGVMKAQETAMDTLATTVATDSVFIFDTVAASRITMSEERNVPDSVLQRLRSDEAFWYANADFKKAATRQPRNKSPLQLLFGQEWFRTLLWVIITGSFCAVILLFLLKSNITLFRKKPAAIAVETEESQETIFSIDYENAVKKAVQAKDYRAAVRYHYLQTLTLLSGKGLITYKEEYTNSDYLMQLRQTPYYSAFKNLTHHFEYAWYGKFAIAPDAFKNIATEFITFKKDMAV